ncbi:PAS domain-containing protein [Pelagibius sp. Alg239-R121]|uniref:PAS domain-containing protein n=1 Tax=Pelagibius sp. Alg239-R121 TaxID=2993448 RepID=UPI0024A66043|nr:PAS domain-containing protein [Pelagibius sp. Alg239-R121]
MCSQPLYSLSEDTPDQIDDPLLADLYLYWSGLRLGSAIPLRSNLDPIDIPHLLPYVILAECYDAGQRIKFRLTGSDIAFAPGSDLTGRYIHERGPKTPYLEHLSELYRLGATSTEGVYSAFSYGYLGDSGPKMVRRIFLPLNGDEDIPSMLLVGQVRDKSTPLAKPIWLTEPELIEPAALFAIQTPSPPQTQAIS